MRRKISLLYLFFTIFLLKAFSQNPTLVDSLKEKLSAMHADSERMNTCLMLSQDYLWSDNDSAFSYAENAISYAKKLSNPQAIIAGKVFEFIAQALKRDDRKAIQTFYETQQLVREDGEIGDKLFFWEWSGILYNIIEDYRKSISYLISYDSSLNALKSSPDPDAFVLISQDYYGMQIPDSAMYYVQLAMKIFKSKGGEGNAVHNTMGNCYRIKGEFEPALQEFRNALFLARTQDKIDVDIIKSQIGLAQTFYSMAKYDSSLSYCRAATYSHNFNTFPDQQLATFDIMQNIYRLRNQFDSAYQYARLTLFLKDSIYSADKTRSVGRAELEQEIKAREVENEKMLMKTN